MHAFSQVGANLQFSSHKCVTFRLENLNNEAVRGSGQGSLTYMDYAAGTVSVLHICIEFYLRR
jgi:hypothetical protein